MSSTSDRTGTKPTATGDEGEPDHYDAFVSYSHQDREFAVRLRGALASRGKSVWLDEAAIHGGADWHAALLRAIERSYVFVFLVSPASVASEQCAAEVDHAVRLGKRILPVRAVPTPIEDLPPVLAARQLIPARETFAASFDHSLNALLTEIEIDRDWVSEHTEWGEKAIEWDRGQRDPSYLLSGSELELAESWRRRASGKRPEPSELQSEYIDASRQAATRRLRRTRGLVSAALAIAIALAVVALIQRQAAVSQSQIASSGRLAALSDLELGTDPQLSLLLAVRAAHTRETAVALDALRRALPANHLIRSLSADASPVGGAQWSPDGRRVLTTSQDGYARIWDASNGAVIRRFPIGTYIDEGAAFDADGGKVVTWGEHGVQVWTVAQPSSAPVSINDPSFVKLDAAAISPDGRLVASTATGGGSAVIVWDADTGRKLRVLEGVGSRYPGAQTSGGVEFSRDNRLILTTQQGTSAIVWNAQTGRAVLSVNAGTGGAGANAAVSAPSAHLSPDGTRLLISTEDDSVQPSAPMSTEVWDIASGRRLATVNGGDGVWSPGGGYIATTAKDGTAFVWVAKNGREVSRMKATDPITGESRFAPDTKGDISELVTGSQTGTATVFNAIAGTQVASLNGDSGQVTPGGFSPDGSRVLTFSTDGAARIWDAGVLEPQRAQSPAGLRSALSSVTSGPLDSEYYYGSDPLGALRAISGGTGATLPVINVRSGAVVARLPPIPGHGLYSTVAFDAHGRVMLVTSSGASGVRPAELRATDGGALLHRLSGPGSLATNGTLSPDGGLAATLDQKDRITVWDVPSGRRLTVFRGHVGASNGYSQANVDFHFSPDGSLILSVDEAGRTFVWRARTGQVLNAIKGPPVPRGQYEGMGGAISPNDRLMVAVYSWDDQAHVYRVGRPGALLTLSGHGGGISDATFNPDSTLLATVSEADQTVRVWDTREQDPILTLQLGQPPQDPGRRIQFSPDGQSLVTDGVMPSETVPCVVCGGFGQLLALARRRETRGFTAAERALYLR